VANFSLIQNITRSQCKYDNHPKLFSSILVLCVCVLVCVLLVILLNRSRVLNPKDDLIGEVPRYVKLARAKTHCSLV